MKAQDIKDVLTVSRILGVSSDPAVVIATLIDWRDGSLGTVEVVAQQDHSVAENAAATVEAKAPAPAKAAAKAPAKAAPKGRAKPPARSGVASSEPDDSVGGEFEPSSDPSEDADF